MLVIASCTNNAAELAQIDAAASIEDADAHAGSGAVDYALDANWLCRPGRDDVCTRDLSAAVIEADGRVAYEAFAAAADPPIDCFYVYPTASRDPGGNSDLNAEVEEAFVTQVQFARFAQNCRTFAPIYRQATLTSLRARMNGGDGPTADRAMAYADVLAAWRHYLEHDNDGRGVVLIGHSQGMAVLTSLIQNEIDGAPVQDLLVSAILLGSNVVVPTGADVGGTFHNIPACRTRTQTGCVISYSTFREDAPPSMNSYFGRPIEPLTTEVIADSQALCTNPANLAGGEGPLESYFPADFRQWSPDGFSWTQTGEAIDATFVATPGLLSARCVNNGSQTYLAVEIHADDEDLRAHDIPGDVVVNGRAFNDWGLHRVDVGVALGDLVDIVGAQGAAYAAAQR